MTDPGSRVSRELKSDDSDQWTTLTVIVIGVGIFTLLVSFALGASFLFKLRRTRRLGESAGPGAQTAEQSQEAPDLEVGDSAAAEADAWTPEGSSSLDSGGVAEAATGVDNINAASNINVALKRLNSSRTKKIDDQISAVASAVGRPVVIQLPSHDENPGVDEDDCAQSESNDCFTSMDLKGIVELGVSEQWYIFEDQVVLEPSFGTLEGAFASVRRGMLSGNHQVAVKVPKCFRNDLSGPMTLANEIRLYRRIRHPNIVLCYGVTIMNLPSPLPCLVLDWVDGGSLSMFVTARRASGEFQRESKEVFSADQARECLSNLKSFKETKLLIDVAWGMQYLHAQKPAILHMDLKPQNILIQDADGQVSAKIADFGLAILLDHDIRKSNVGTVRYMAPEVQQNRTYHKPAEVYSFGLTVAFAISGQHPPKAKKADVISVLHKQMVQLLQVPHLPRKLVKICTRCLSPKPTSRPSFAELCILLAGAGATSSSADGGSQNPNSSGDKQNLSSQSTSACKSSGSDSSLSCSLSDIDLSGLSSLSGARIDRKAKEAAESREGSSHAGSDRSDKERKMRSNRKKDVQRMSL